MRRAGEVLLVALALTAAACNNVEPKRTQVLGKKTTVSTTSTVVAGQSASDATPATSTSSGAGASAGTATTAGSGNATDPRAAAPVIDVNLKATKMATLERPTALAARPGELTAVYVATKGGTVRRLRVGATGGTLDVFNTLDISAKVSSGSEQGLLGIVFSVDGNTLYATYTDKPAGTIHVAAFPFANGRAQAANERTIITIPHPDNPDHNGGHIAFGPDGYLYIGLGDGGGVGDPRGNAQNLGSLLGKMLRIKPNPSGGYTVPADNPFLHTAGARPEIWHYGLRNPWGWSFDRANGEMWIGDVGQNEYEEVNHVAAGAKGLNFGWNLREGKHAYNGGAKPPGAVDPEIETAHKDKNCAVTGGYVYRGATIKGLVGIYLFADYCRGELVGAVGGVTRELGVHFNEPASFGEDATGELWVLSQSGGIFRLDGR